MSEVDRKKRKAEYDRQRYERKKEEHKQRCQEYYSAHKDEIKQRTASYRKSDLEKSNQYSRTYYSKNKEKFRHKAGAHYRAKLQAQPKWLTDTQKREIAAFYQNRPQGCEVDHIVPLKGSNVCGLHVPWNLQYLTRAANRSKGNRHD